jgi:GNAT superfamily N-acetyltransferase
MPQITYSTEPDLAPGEFARVLRESGLGAHRPVDDEARLAAMLTGANLILTARLNGALVGVARCISDFAWCAYVSELAVSPSAQGLHIGQGLLARARENLGPEVSLILISVPEAAGFYAHAGMERIDDAFWYRRQV